MQYHHAVGHGKDFIFLHADIHHGFRLKVIGLVHGWKPLHFLNQSLKLLIRLHIRLRCLLDADKVIQNRHNFIRVQELLFNLRYRFLLGFPLLYIRLIRPQVGFLIKFIEPFCKAVRLCLLSALPRNWFRLWLRFRQGRCFCFGWYERNQTEFPVPVVHKVTVHLLHEWITVVIICGIIKHFRHYGQDFFHTLRDVNLRPDCLHACTVLRTKRVGAHHFLRLVRIKMVDFSRKDAFFILRQVLHFLFRHIPPCGNQLVNALCNLSPFQQDFRFTLYNLHPFTAGKHINPGSRNYRISADKSIGIFEIVRLLLVRAVFQEIDINAVFPRLHIGAVLDDGINDFLGKRKSRGLFLC